MGSGTRGMHGRQRGTGGMGRDGADMASISGGSGHGTATAAVVMDEAASAEDLQVKPLGC